MEKVKIVGMSCRHCATAVEKALLGVEGVKSVAIDLDRGEATLEMAGPLDGDRLQKAVEEAGYRLG